ncbi:hypothetical protein TKK_0004088 [Trichogramma kaykai]|uniref:ubiquitinyl hydrolase 1 n=1 Tax=Trichogramma kaykai TaxID=54128 RepID=A0ABD2XKT4_9HYME
MEESNSFPESRVDTLLIPEYPEADEVMELGEISPLTTSLDHNLIIKDQSPKSEKMGVENNWGEANGPDVSLDLPVYGPSEEFPKKSCESTDYYQQNGKHEDEGSVLHSQRNNDDTQERVAGVCGLHNLGNTCFMAAGLQCLTATPTVQHHFLQLQENSEKLPPPGTLMSNFSFLLSEMWSGAHDVLHPTEFKKALGLHHSQFKDYRQHDCQEFLALLLDSLHEQMNLAKTNNSCYVPSATATSASSTICTDINLNSNDDLYALRTSSITASNVSKFMDQLDDGPPSFEDGPNSPNITMAGSPKDSLDDMDSTANSARSSPMDIDEETLDSEDIGDHRTRFIHNDMRDLLHDDAELEKYIEKNAKTSNTNFLITSEDYNNEICYDSQKFSKDNNRRIPLENANLTENHDFDNKSICTKRIKEVNCERDHCNNSECGVTSTVENECESRLEKSNVKRRRLADLGKVYKPDGLESIVSQNTQSNENGAIALEDEVEADKHWSKHLEENRSIIVDTFQGQFKSTVVCEACKHVSMTYEPFMYLSVPLPHAMERQFSVTYVSADGTQPIHCVITLNKMQKLRNLKMELVEMLDKKDVLLSDIALALVFAHHVSKILDENMLLRKVDDTNRSIYAFELSSPPQPWGINGSSSEYHWSSVSNSFELLSKPGTSNGISPSKSVNPNDAIAEDVCTICLDENNDDLKKHTNEACTLIICDSCIESYFKSGKEEIMKCPVCSKDMTRNDFVKVQDQKRLPKVLLVPFVMRHDIDEGSNNSKETKLFGDIRLFRLTSRIDAKIIYDTVNTFAPKDIPYTVHFVNAEGNRCSRCMFSSHCTGCQVPESGEVTLSSSDTLAVRYVDQLPQIPPPIEHESVKTLRPISVLSLYDCLQAFSQSEVLDSNNPWFCPKCERNQCATKTMTVHRYPKFLIVYLKRFIYHDRVSVKLEDKVTFPLVGLNCGKHLYDLYACVCHYGSIAAGHYTAYAKNPEKDTWYHYNDDICSRKKPQEEDFSKAYILFYRRQESNIKQCNISV